MDCFADAELYARKDGLHAGTAVCATDCHPYSRILGSTMKINSGLTWGFHPGLSLVYGLEQNPSEVEPD